MKRTLLFGLWVCLLFSANNSYADAMRKMYLPVGFTDWSYGFDLLSPDDVKPYCCLGGRVYHQGVDINKASCSGDCEKGLWLPVYAIADGEVVFADDSDWASVIIEHDFNGQKTYYSVYGHTRINPKTAEESSDGKADNSFTKVEVGDNVRAGQQIGYVWDIGETEDNRMASHLHYEVRKSNHPDPEGLGFCSILGGTSRNRVKDWYVHPVDFVKSEGYIDGHCAEITSNRLWKSVICWFDSDDAEEESLCEDGVAHKIYRKYLDKVILTDRKLGKTAVEYYCGKSDDSVDIIDFLSIKSFIPGGSDSGGGVSDGGNNGNVDPHAGYVHDVGIHKVQVSPRKKKGYKSEITVTLEQLSQISLNFRAKLKRKGVWEDVCVDFYLSNDDNYDSSDQHIGEKCKDLTKRKYRNKKKKSVYLRKVDMSEYITSSGEYHVSIKVYNDKGEKINESDDSDEVALITVISNPNDPIYQP
ncbi:MAG: M23 family metallopeptidase, partial [Melioribacteraceae bacterium]|nr:M23 family metallopeptidase [Melioribacteraceae bacterium]